MKKIFTIISLTALSFFGYSQSIQLFEGTTNVTNTTITKPIQAGDMVYDDIEIRNVSSSAINFLVQRVIVNPPLDSMCNLYFCTGILCYAPSWNVVFNEPGTGNALAASSSLTGSNGLIPHLDVGPNCCDLYVLYKVYNTLLPNDTAKVTIHYQCVSGINDHKKGGAISTAYPNPANDFVSLKYNVSEFSQEAKIVFYDMLGKAVKEVVLDDKHGLAKINVSGLTSGVYFYSFVVDNVAITTRKIVISAK
jgi:hypothetical protein